MTLGTGPRTLRTVLVSGLVLLAPALAVTLLAITGGLEAAVAGLPDPGLMTRVGLPAARAARDTAGAVTIGLLVTAATLLPSQTRAIGGLDVVQQRALRLGAGFGTGWAAAGFLVLVLTFADLTGAAPLGPGWSEQLAAFTVQLDLGRSLGATVVLSAAATALAGSATKAATAGWAALVAVVAVLPLALTGHSASAADHAAAVDAQAGHLIGVSIWVGGLAALLLLRRHIGGAFPVVVGRYSRLAGWCYVLVALSGLVGGWVRLGGVDGLFQTPYGALLLVKVMLLLALGVAGWCHRRRMLPQLGGVRPGRAFTRLAVAELLLMGAAMGVAVALSRTSPQVPGSSPRTLSTPEALLGYPMPPPLQGLRWLTEWRVDTVWAPVAVLGLGWYLVAAIRLRRRGDRWPLGRVASWACGCVLLVAATSASPGVYGSVLFSMHMVQHMTIAMAVPVFLVLGAPVTLALRTTSRRRDGSRGPREWLLVIVHSRLLQLLGHPLVAPVLFIGSLVAFYYSPLFELALRTHTGHVLMIAHFILTGYLFASVIVGIDPGPKRPEYPFRMVILMATFGFHAFFAVGMMSATRALGADWFAALGRTWGNTLEREQYLGGAISWALGDYPIAILAFAMITGWIRSDAREARRYDRQADRDADAALAAHNAYLQQLGRRFSNSTTGRDAARLDHHDNGKT